MKRLIGILVAILLLGIALYSNHQIYLIRKQPTPVVEITNCEAERMLLKRLSMLRGELIDLLKLKIQLEKNQHTSNKDWELEA